MPDRDEHYVKYRVFHEPSEINENIGHPVPVEAIYATLIHPDGTWVGEEILNEVEGLFFVLRPEQDHYARQAIAAYAYACRRTHPHLAADLIAMIESLEWEEETGQHRDDMPLESEDYLEGEHLSDNVVQMLKQRIPD